MNVISVLKEINKRIRVAKKAEFLRPIEKQMRFLDSVNRPQNDFDRSYNQYKCQRFLRGRVISCFINITSIPVYYLLKQRYLKSEFKIGDEKEVDAVFLSDGKNRSIIPNSLSVRFPLLIDEEDEQYHLSDNDCGILEEIKRMHPLSYEFLLKTLVKIARYSSIIDRYSPKALIVCNEYSFTSSLLREFCERKGVKLINVMHGEKLLCIHDAFFHFDECFVWHDHYRRLFSKVKAEDTQFRVEIPPMLSIELTKVGDKAKYDFTYYLGMDTERELESIIGNLSRLTEKGFKVAIRPHPRYTNSERVEKLMDKSIDLYLEDFNETTIEESLCNTEAVISRISTVLLQALFAKKEVVIDDITAPNEYLRLKDMDYIILNAEHKLLSECLMPIY